MRYDTPSWNHGNPVAQKQSPDNKYYEPSWHEATEYQDKYSRRGPSFPVLAPDKLRNMSYCAIGDRGVNEVQEYWVFAEPPQPFYQVGGAKNQTPSSAWLDNIQQFFRDYPSLLARLRGTAS